MMTGTLKPLPAVCKLVTGGTEPKNISQVLPPFQNDWWIVDARLKIKWSIIASIIMGTSTILQKIAHWESTNHFGTEGV